MRPYDAAVDRDGDAADAGGKAAVVVAMLAATC
jgi:hypothetical protein